MLYLCSVQVVGHASQRDFYGRCHAGKRDLLLRSGEITVSYMESGGNPTALLGFTADRKQRRFITPHKISNIEAEFFDIVDKQTQILFTPYSRLRYRSCE